MSLGYVFAPVAIGGILAALGMTGVMAWGISDTIEANARKGVNPPTPPPAPAGPQSQAELTSWSPGDLFARQRENWAAWRPNAVPGQPAPAAIETPPGANGDGDILLAALAIGAISLVLVMRD